MITADALKELLYYDSDTGVWTWKVSLGTAKAGSVAGCINSSTGYRIIRIKRKQYVSSRLAHLYMTGE